MARIWIGKCEEKHIDYILIFFVNILCVHIAQKTVSVYISLRTKYNDEIQEENQESCYIVIIYL